VVPRSCGDIASIRNHNRKGKRTVGLSWSVHPAHGPGRSATRDGLSGGVPGPTARPSAPTVDPPPLCPPREVHLKLLLVEDDRIVRITVRDALEESGYGVTACADGTSAAAALASQAFDIVLTDVRLPGQDGLSLFRRVRRDQPGTAVIIMTAYADTEDAVAVMREGARDYVLKPFEMDELVSRVGRVREELEFRRRMEQGGAPRQAAGAILGTSLEMRRVLERVESAAETDVAVLIMGETGTGKDLCARTIHEGSRRAAKPFVVVNCAAIPDALFESELFGHEKGAFTGADRRRQGRFEVADGGSLFLDEIGELSPVTQAKLLRALETSTFERVGSSQSLRVDVRIMAATNRDLTADIARGRFRRDLFYRLNVIDIVIPPLRERRADIAALVSHFLPSIAARQGRPPPVLDPAVTAALARYDFPGNVRELIHVLERAVALARGGPVRLEHLSIEIAAALAAVGDPSPAGASTASPSAVQPLGAATEQFEREYIQRALDQVGGHRTRAAELLGISRKSLWERLRDARRGEPDGGG
jgi:DNA-binding NtrC family response regulator